MKQSSIVLIVFIICIFVGNVTMEITFQVSSVSSNLIDKPEKPFSPEQILPDPGYTSHVGKDDDIITYKRLPSQYETKPIQSSFEYSSSNRSIIQLGSNSFVMSCVNAYSKHHNLIIKPDDVWLSISTQFSNYLNSKSEELREKFVDFHEGEKKQLTVYGGGTLFTADYEQLSNEMAEQIAKNIKDPSIRNWIIPDFSTSTKVDRMVGSAVLMGAMKNYFDYKFELSCNLPNVTLLGNVKDWIQVRERAERLLEFETKEGYMQKWTSMLLPILDKFVETAKGNPDIEWWNRIAHWKGGGSGPSYISGWITVFCVFTEKGYWKGDERSVTTISDKKITSEWPIIDSEEIPRGYVNVPILIVDDGIHYNTEMFAGHLVSDILPDGKTIQPRLDWILFQTKN